MAENEKQDNADFALSSVREITSEETQAGPGGDILYEKFKNQVLNKNRAIAKRYGSVLRLRVWEKVTEEVIDEMQKEAEKFGNAYATKFVLDNFKEILAVALREAKKGKQWAILYLTSFIDGKQRSRPKKTTTRSFEAVASDAQKGETPF